MGHYITWMWWQNGMSYQLNLVTESDAISVGHITIKTIHYNITQQTYSLDWPGTICHHNLGDLCLCTFDYFFSYNRLVKLNTGDVGDFELVNFLKESMLHPWQFGDTFDHHVNHLFKFLANVLKRRRASQCRFAWQVCVLWNNIDR